jgi:hypothetical protein
MKKRFYLKSIFKRGINGLLNNLERFILFIYYLEDLQQIRQYIG